MIYVNYPSIFRKIFSAETDSRRGFFSLVTRNDPHFPRNDSAASHSEREYRNSTLYVEYLKALTPRQQFVLNRIFQADTRLKSTLVSNVTEEELKSFACFNQEYVGKGGHTLERHLHLIVKLSQPPRQETYQFYLNAKNRFVSGGTIEELLESHPGFSASTGENSRKELFRVLVNSTAELDHAAGSRLISYFLNHIQEYSHLEIEQIELGLRDSIPLYLIKLLDTVGWTDQHGTRRDNLDTNIAAISDWIFGEGKHNSNGVLEILSKQSRGVSGLFDLMMFRLYCCADRGGEYFNLHKALTQHHDPSAPTSGVLIQIVIPEMREISQRVFEIFKKQYIEKNIDILELIDNLTLEDLAGIYGSFVNDMVKNGRISESDKTSSINVAKTRMKAFITYQLTNNTISSGIGCGYYDPNGNADQNGIRNEMNDYLFTTCFNPNAAHGYEHFLDYLLINFPSQFFSRRDGGVEYTPTAEGFTKILERSLLIQYWLNNSQEIKSRNFQNMDKRLFTANYIANYNEDLMSTFNVLDELTSET